MKFSRFLSAIGIGSIFISVSNAQPPTPALAREPMTNARIDATLKKLDLEMVAGEGPWQLVVAGREVMVITDVSANRMRILTPVVAAQDLSEENLRRVMQANFDSALDARYAIAKGQLWSTFIHPLGSLDDEALLLGLGQVVNLANTFGSSYSSGLLLFGGGDSRGIRERELIDEILDKGLAI
ncbi:MAG: hypothetical protein ACI9BW_000908 [Gammaproteobacteria bacterium]|jgi:hypothetical protein